MSSFRDRFHTAKRFKLDLFKCNNIFQDNSGNYRTYITPEGNSYPSITSVLSANPEKAAMLQTWKDRVGEAEAARVSQKASKNGNIVHDALEQYVLGHKVTCVNPQYKGIKKVLDEHVDNIRGIEIPLYSDIIKIAGTSDLVADFDNELSVIDYKTSLKLKREEWITDYFLQSTFYALSIKERYGILPKYLVIIIGVEGEAQPQIFKMKIKNYITKLVEAKQLFDKINN